MAKFLVEVPDHQIEAVLKALSIPVNSMPDRLVPPDVAEAELLNGPEEHKIKIELIFGKMPDEEVLDMSETGNKFKLFMDNDGALGIHGGAKFSCLDDIKKFIADAEEELVKGFNFQKDRGALPAMA